jgi:hypothetical protein
LDALERLRSHKLPFVSGYYLRRRYDPLFPVWFTLPPKGQWLMNPWTGIPERGKLHPLGASGWGCILIHRDVITATKALLKGEMEIIEDDMDIWPYDLAKIIEAMKGLRELANTKPKPPIAWPALEHHLQTLESEIRVLSGVKDFTGSDIRYVFYAREAGFTLMGDPDVRCGHMLDYTLMPDDYEMQPPEALKNTQEGLAKAYKAALRRVRDEKNAVNGDAA